MSMTVGAQLYTLRDHCTNPDDFATTCERLRAMGFTAVQVSAVKIDDPKVIRKILDEHGLVCAATHRSMDQLRDIEACLDYHRELDCELTALGGFFNADRDAWVDFVAEFSGIADQLADQGLRVGYHNHSHEFSPFAQDPAKISPTDVPMQLLVDKAGASVWFEFDTYWVQHGGADPAAWINKAAAVGDGRVPAIHVKDMTVTPKREQKMCEVGAGNLNWPPILDAARRAGTKWLLIERDDGDVEPFESLRISLMNLQAMGV